MKQKITLFICLSFAIGLAFWQLVPTAFGGGGEPENIITVTTTDDVVNSLDMQCSLREAVIAANTNTASGIVVGECDAGLDEATDYIYLEDGETYTLTLQGAGEDAAATGDLDVLDNAARLDLVVTTGVTGTAVINASSLQDRHFHMVAGGMRLENLEITFGSAPLGGAIYNEDYVAILNSIIALNTAEGGGAIYNTNAEATMEIADSTFSRNMTTNNGNGGGFFNQGTIALYTSNIVGNMTNGAGSGGGIFNNGGVLYIVQSTFSDNVANDGGGIYNTATGMITSETTLFTINEAANRGGALFNLGSAYLNNQSRIEKNIADGLGGGGLYNGGTIQVVDSLIEQNQVTDTGDNSMEVGAGIYAVVDSDTQVIRSAVISNSLDYLGGGLALNGSFLIVNSTISGNEASGIGGIYVGANGNGVIANATIAHNLSDGLEPIGTGIHNLGGTVQIVNSIMSHPELINCTSAGGTFTSNGYNIADDLSGSCFNNVADMVDTDPMLGALNDEWVYPITEESPAFDAADDVVCDGLVVEGLDQLSTSRPQYEQCDIGAYELPSYQVYIPLVIK